MGAGGRLLERATARRSHHRARRRAGDTVIDWAWPVPEPTPVTTIAWRIGHVAVGWAHRAALHFGGPPVDYDTVDWPLDATGALRLLDESHARWAEGVGRRSVSGTAACVW